MVTTHDNNRTIFYGQVWNAGNSIVVTIPAITAEAMKITEGVRVRIILKVIDDGKKIK